MAERANIREGRVPTAPKQEPVSTALTDLTRAEQDIFRETVTTTPSTDMVQDVVQEVAVPAKPKPVAGADWVWRGNQWVLTPKGEDKGEFITMPDGSLTTSPAASGGGGSDAGGGGGGQTWTATDGTPFTNFQNYLSYQEVLDGKRQGRQSAWDLLFQEFAGYGLGSLVEPLKGLISDPSVSASEFTIRLRQTEAYKKRFAANQARVAKGLRALDEGSYLELEDQYQNIMRSYGLPQSYYTRSELGRQEGFEKFIEFDVSPVELEERISNAQNRVTNAAPEVMQSLKDFYGDTITNGDVLAYVLNPNEALSQIKRRITAAEIGAGARQAGLSTTAKRAEQLAGYGVTAEQARQGFQTVAELTPRGGQLAEIYKETPYTQQTAEQEVFNLAGGTEAARQRRRLTGREQAAFSGSSGAYQGALSRDRAGGI